MDHFLCMSMFAYLLLCFIPMLASLNLGFAMLCALHGLVLAWSHPSFLGIDWVWPFVRYTPVVLVCLIHTFLRFARRWYACLACFVPPVWLSLLLCFLFACFPTCSCMCLCVVHNPIQWNYGHLIQTYICPPRTPPFVW